MIVFDVMVDGQHVDTVKPTNQRPREMYWIMVDHIHNLRTKHGNNVSLHRRIIHYA